MFRFHKAYFVISLVLFLTEVLIAMYVHDNFIRPYFGDFLVVILLYSFLRSFIDSGVRLTAISVLLFSYLIELLQYLNFVDKVGLGDSEIARTLIGTSFAWIDLLAYSAGFLTVLWFEKMKTIKLILNNKKR